MRRQRHNAVEQDEVTMLADYFGFSAPPDAHQAGRRLSARRYTCCGRVRRG
jgi:hypothetical protein